VVDAECLDVVRMKNNSPRRFRPKLGKLEGLAKEEKEYLIS